jgi:hypothetical protein
MAENESLELWDRDCRRWLPFLRKIEHGAPVNEIVATGLRCVCGASKRLTSLLPLAEILQAAKRRDHEAIHELVRPCWRARDYGELYEQCARNHSDPYSLEMAVKRQACDTILDQVEREIVRKGNWPDLARFRVRRGQILAAIEDGLPGSARQVVNEPQRKPRMPTRSAAQKEKERGDLLNLSLRNAGQDREDRGKRVSA